MPGHALFHGGNTPTCMGKTDLQRVGLLVAGKHPHVHGEDLVKL